MSEQATQPLEWIRERQQQHAQQRRHDLKVDAVFAALMLAVGVALMVIALGV